MDNETRSIINWCRQVDLKQFNFKISLKFNTISIYTYSLNKIIYFVLFI